MLPPLPDVRLQRRFQSIVAAVSKSPERSFPQALPDSADLEAVYRFLSNERVDWQQLLEPEVVQTLQRLVDAGSGYAIHDTSNIMLTGESARGDVGSLDGHGASFLAHFCLVVSMGPVPGPLGLLGIDALFRPDGPRRKQPDWKDIYHRDDKESLRWPRMVDRAESLVAGRASLLHLMDSEGDDFALLSSLVAQARRFVVRVKQNRALTDEDAGNLSDALAAVEAIACRQVMLGARSKAACRGRNTTRRARRARPSCRFAPVASACAARRTSAPPAPRLSSCTSCTYRKSMCPTASMPSIGSSTPQSRSRLPNRSSPSSTTIARAG